MGTTGRNRILPTAAAAALVVVLLSLAPAGPARAQEAPESDVQFTHGPATVELGDDVAQLQVPEGYLFADAATTRKLMERMGNPPSDREVGLITPADREGSSWYVVFEYDPSGYVRDDEKDEIDAKELLDNISESTEAANKQRQKMGFAPLHVSGWLEEPHYDSLSHNLVWSMEATEEGTGERVANYNTRYLGRRGVMSVTVATDPSSLAGDLPEVNQVLSGFSYKPGSRYADFVSGDKVAKYGLTALIAGGAGAAAVKLGLFGVLAKFLGKAWKLVVAGLAALGAAVKRIFGRKKPDFSGGQVG